MLGLGLAITKMFTPSGNVVPIGYKAFMVTDTGGSQFKVTDSGGMDFNVK